MKTKKRIFKYYPEDFGALNVQVLHMNLNFDVYEKHTVVDCAVFMKTLKEIESLDLNANNLEILEIECYEYPMTFKYLKDEDIIKINFSKKIPKGKEVTIKTKTICRPTNNILEGLYYDETPKCCPPQQITQCQQWGFQRIVPCIDDMTAKCTYKTTITADERYTNLLSNGDVSKNIKSVGNGRAKIEYDNLITPMATYLFFLGVGTYATFKKEFEYPNGDVFMLELLVPPKSNPVVAGHALQVLYDAIMWVYLFTGPDKYENWQHALKIKKLIKERDELKDLADNSLVKNKINVLAELKKLRARLKKETAGATWGYKYTGTVYREIGMQNSDFGGMENVGNTTITTNRIMPFPEMTDGGFEYMIQVKVHEFYHNLNGSEVTGRSPFEIWLNEAVTVFIEHEYHRFLFGEEYSRLETVLNLLYPGSGTMAMDDNVASMPIEPDGFNDPNELITGVTYVKAPEFVRMIETLMGRQTFAKGLDLYHTRYKHSNASRAQWVACMEEASGMNFQRMAEVWLKQSSYPKVHVDVVYKKGEVRLKLEQKGFKPGMHWEFPFNFALCDADGRDIHSQTYHVKNVKEEIVIKEICKPTFVSLNREYGFFGKVFHHCGDDELYVQVYRDRDIVNRYMAFHSLAEREKMKLLENKKAKVSDRFIDLYFDLLNDDDLMGKVAANMLPLFQHVEDPRFSHSYQELHDVVKKIRFSVAEKYSEELMDLYKKYADKKFYGDYLEVQIGKIKARQVKNLCLGLLAELDTKEVHKMIKDQYLEADCATDKVAAFSLYLNSSAKDKLKVLDEYQKVAEKNLVSWESFLSVVARNDSEDFLEIIRRVETSKVFRIEQANDQRALYGSFASNRKKSLLTKEGRKFVEDSLIKLSPINEYNAGHVLKVFGVIDSVPTKYQADLVRVLMNVKKKLDPKATPSISNTIERILAGSPKGMKEYKKSL